MTTDITQSKFYQYQKKKNPSADKMYFSGANARVYFGDTWVEEMVSIQFSVDENVAPIYGFNSYMFDKVARGTRIVSGAFILNHTESGYLNILLDRIYENLDTENRALLSQDNLSSLIDSTRNAESSRNIENLLQIDGNDSYNEYVEDLKKSFWGNSTKRNTIYRSGQAREYDTNYFKDKEGSQERNILKDHGFNILIDYSPDANDRDFKDCIEDMNKSKSLYQSFRSIIGVHITGENQVISPSGEPIQTQYNFIARDIDGDVSQLSMKYNQLHSFQKELDVPKRTESSKSNSMNKTGATGAGARVTPLRD